MKRVAILSCRNAGQVCAGVSCLQAFFERDGSFAAYGEEPLRLTAFLQCNGCQGVEDQGPFDQGTFRPLREDAGMLKKLDRMEREGVEIVHLGICCWNRAGEICPWVAELKEELQRRGMEVVKGTHRHG